ncbi:CDP-alcohol phosphatidyltransferase [Enemella dayhoffiae]|uniref:CDP-alcohol phosphatidyltransferase n=1 Tax=Enemella dayhoffiae TaxID=2016507 RepID=A0A255GVI5_9ACTN|nr:CDP-alcohol phosphatidyltransferase family protein [Enemella dayhoffiae]OYO17244.1 CDP-alcohol phosphatidyltransferase [Enemella dayhoffiae]
MNQSRRRHHGVPRTSRAMDTRTRPHRPLARPLMHGGRRLSGLALRPDRRQQAGTAAVLPVRSERLVAGDRSRRRMIGFALVQACTLGSILLGLAAILLSSSGRMTEARACLLGCIALDGLDGTLARRFGVSTPFGAQLDSLADMASFGIATPLVTYFWLADRGPAWIVGGGCIAISLAAAVRLARFNVTPYNSTWFQGLPTTIAALILIGASLAVPELDFVTAMVMVLGCAAAMVSLLPYPKLNQMLRIRTWLLSLIGVGAIISMPTVFLAVIGTFLLIGPILGLWYRFAEEDAPTFLE